MLGSKAERVSTGIPGVDEILQGGFIPDRSCLIRGGPGTGKTIFGLHFLTAGAENGEKTLFISMNESQREIEINAHKVNFSLEGIDFLDLAPTSDFFSKKEAYDIFAPAEVERDPTTEKIIAKIEAIDPRRVFIDSITQLKYLSTDVFQFRKQVLSFVRYLVQRGITVVYTSESSPQAPDDDLQFLADCVINIGYSAEGERTIFVTKFRGSGFQGGQHSLKISNNGMEVFPRLVPEVSRRHYTVESLSSGSPGLDQLLNGGIERGTVTIISGPSGVGKTTAGLQFMKEAAARGERSVIYTFEEDVETLLARSESIQIPIRMMIERDILSAKQVEPLRYTADEFARSVKDEVERNDIRMVMIDSTAGYRLSIRGRDIVTHLHLLTEYLSNMGVTVLLISEIENIAGGDFKATEFGISYLADNIIFFRYLELHGELKKAIGVLKKRLSDFEKTMREFEITRHGIKVGKPLTDLRGILTGTPEFVQPAERKRGEAA